MADKEYIVVAPDGKEITLIGPEGASKEQLIAQAQRLYQPSKATVTINPFEASMKEAVQNVPESKRIMGAALGGLGGETIKNVGALTELVSSQYGKPITQFGQAMTNASSEANPVTGTIGQIASYVAPTNAVSKLLPTVKALMPNMAKQAAVGGTVAAGTTPGSFEERLPEIALNAAMGGTLPVVGAGINKLYQGGKSMIEPLYEQGKNAIIARALREFSGGDANKAIANLTASKPIVEGSLPTVGQAANVPSLAAAERALIGSTPEATNMLANRQAQNALARTNVLENIASPSRVEKYTDLRAKLGNDLYEPALQKAMDFSKLSPELQQQVNNLIKAPAIQNAMKQARTNALNKEIDIGDPSGSLRGLHETKLALDQEINAVKAKLERDGAGATSAELNGLKAAKDRLLSFIENPQISPEYKQARETFARLSKPVNQLEEISKLADKSVSPKENTIYTDRFFKELDKIKKEGVLSKQQIARLETIGQDLKSKSFAENAGRGVGSNTMQNLAYANMANQIGIPNMLRNMPGGQIVGGIAKRAGDVVYGKANKEIANQMAETFLSPQRAAELMQMPPNANLNTQQAQNLAKLLTLQLSTQGEK
jgi:hypothetical protein